jgi:hypothetical protein
MNQNIMLIGLLIGAMFFLRRPRATGGWAPSGVNTYIGRRGAAPMTGGPGTGYRIDYWGDEG